MKTEPLLKQKMIYTAGRHVQGSLYEEVNIVWKEDGWYYITTSMIDRFNGGGTSGKVPECCLTDGEVDENRLLIHIAKTHSYMETMSRYR